MQRLSWTMDEGKIVKWLKNEGDSVNKGDELLEVETEKVNVALEAPGSGLLRKKLCVEGDIVPVGTLIAVIADADENIQSALEEAQGASQKPMPSMPQALAATGSSIEARETPLATEFIASPRARRLAREKGIDLKKVKGSGPQGRIVEEDILRFAQQKQEPRLPFTVLKTVQVSGQRKVIADRMLTSLQTKAQITLTTEVDMTEAKQLREKMSEQGKGQSTGVGVAYNDLLIRAVAVALKEHRMFNALMIQDEVKIIEEINVGLAVATDSGLVVPVVKNADKLTLLEIAQRTSELVERARLGSLKVSDVSDGTFTITNLGMYQVDVNTAIINPPQVAILALGRIVEKAVVVKGKVMPRHMMTMCLTFDHRITDGVTAAKFLQDLKRCLEEPASRLVVS